MLGYAPESVPTLVLAAEAGLATPLDRIEVVGADPRELRPSPRWRPAAPKATSRLAEPGWLSPLVRRLLTVKPAFDRARCDGCEQCLKICAAGALAHGARDGNDRRPAIDRDRCISCFCCQEICPQGAITVSAGLAARVFGLGPR